MGDVTRIDRITSREVGANKDPIFSDFYVNLNSHPTTGFLTKYLGADAVKRSIRNIILTDTTERLFNPTLGSGIRNLLFEHISQVTSELIKTKITEVINQHEPRARIIDVFVVPDESRHLYSVSVVFQVINTNNPINLNLTLYRVR